MIRSASEWKPEVEGSFANLPAERYHAAPGFSHSASLWLDPPARFQYRNVEKPTQYMILGTLAHAMALEPDKPLPGVVTKPANYPAPPDSSLVKSKKVAAGDLVDWNGNANYCKKWMAAQEAAGLIVLTQVEMDELDGMVRAVNAHDVVGPVLRNSITEVSIFHAHVDGDDMVLRKCRIDAVPVGKNALLDYKTVDEASDDAAFKKLEYDGWDTQAANNLDLWNYQNPEDYRDQFGYVMIERKPPHIIKLIRVSQGYLERGRQKMAERIHVYARCVRENKWPGYPSEWVTIEPRRRNYA